MGTFRELSEGMADAVAKAGGSVVEVRGRRRPAAGIAVDATRVVTASHAVPKDAELQVVDAAGAVHRAELVGRDPATDLALLSAPTAALAAPTWADPATVRPGALVLPLGRRGDAVRVVLGIVAEVGPAWKTALGGDVDRWIDVNADLPPGFSGGPLVDADGHVIGLDTRGLTPRGAVVPADTLRRVVDLIAARGPVAPGYLGVGFYPSAANGVEALVVVSVEPGGPGDRAGVAVGDVLESFDGLAVHGVRHLLGLLAARGAGVTVTLALRRGGQPLPLPVTLASRPHPLGCR